MKNSGSSGYGTLDKRKRKERKERKGEDRKSFFKKERERGREERNGRRKARRK